VIPAATLLGADAVAVGGWSRFHVTADLDAALAVLEARLLDEHEVADVAALRRAAPYEEPLPPLLLIADTPSRRHPARVRTVLAWAPRPTSRRCCSASGPPPHRDGRQSSP
jgi:hypothetical protein